MPDAALEATEAQFGRLLRESWPEGTVDLRLVYLPEIARGEAAEARLRKHYWPVDELLASSSDALIVTGLEPGLRPLAEEPYWPRLVQLMEWAERRTRSSLWSSLAAHAAVLHLDGVQRRRLPAKCFGVFDHLIAADHPLVSGIVQPFRMPHSRWNALPLSELRDAGYQVLSTSVETGADLFVRQRESLFVFLQGHPEYESTTLLKEYRRDIGRFLRGLQPQYPGAPQGYFAPDTAELLNRFQARAERERDPGLLDCFPFTELEEHIQTTWRAGARCLFRNWLALATRVSKR